MLRRSTATALGPGFAGLGQGIAILRRSTSVESVNSAASLRESVGLESETDWDEQEVEDMLAIPPSGTTTLLVTIYRAAVYQFIASWIHAFTRIPSTMNTVGRRSAISVGRTATDAANLVRSTWRGFGVRRSPPPTAAQSPQPTKPARIVRRPMALDDGTSHFMPTAISHAQAPHPLPAPAPSNFQTVAVAATSRRRTFPRPKSLQNSWRWRGFASSSNPSDVTQSPRLARIDICVKVTRMVLNSLHSFRRYFKYGVPSAEAAIESICDNPVLEWVEGDWRPSQARQPALIVHRMFWEGEKKRVFEALKAADMTTLTSLSISHCSISTSDLVAILGTWLSLESLEVRDIVSKEHAGELRFPVSRRKGGFRHNLSSLTINSYASLNSISKEVDFQRLSSLDLRLHGDANYSNLEALLLNAFLSEAIGNTQRALKIRGRLGRSKQLELEAVLRRLGDKVAAEYSHM